MEMRRKFNVAAHTPSEMLACELEAALKINKDPAVKERLKRSLEMVTNLELYLEETASSQTNLQEKVYLDTYNDPNLTPNYLNMISGPVEGQFLKIMAEMTGAKRILEIGMFTGYSAVSFAESPYCKEMVCLDIVPRLEELVKSKIRGTSVENKVRIIIGPAAESLQILKDEGKKFDLVFIDADKPGYINYYKFIMDNGLLEQTGSILCDNVLWGSDPYTGCTSNNGKELKQFTEFVKNDNRVIQMICPIRDGVLLIKPKLISNE